MRMNGKVVRRISGDFMQCKYLYFLILPPTLFAIDIPLQEKKLKL